TCTDQVDLGPGRTQRWLSSWRYGARTPTEDGSLAEGWLRRGGRIRRTTLPPGSGEHVGTRTVNWPLFVQLVWDGLVAGSLYALMAFSFSLIYFTTRILHFAHGAMMVALTYVIFACCHYWGFSWPLATLAAALVGAMAGIFFERGLYRTVRRRTAARVLPTGALFIASLGAALIITNVLPIIFGPEPRFLGIGPYAKTVLLWNNRLALGWVGLWTVGGTAVILGAAVLWLMKSTQGRRIRAIIDDSHTARIVGIPIESTYLVVFA